jgi:hypothetical protein
LIVQKDAKYVKLLAYWRGLLEIIGLLTPEKTPGNISVLGSSLTPATPEFPANSWAA